MNIKCDYGYQSFETGFHDFADEYFVYKSSKTADSKVNQRFLVRETGLEPTASSSQS